MAALAADLPTASVFPLFDIWRLAILEQSHRRPTRHFYATAFNNQRPRDAVASRLLLPPAGAQDARGAFTSVLVQTLLYQDRLVRVAAASLVFNVGSWVQMGQVAWTKGGREEAVCGFRMDEEDGEWEVELVNAIVEALTGEEESEDACTD